MDQLSPDFTSENEFQQFEITVVDSMPSHKYHTNISRSINCQTMFEQNYSDHAYASKSNKLTEIPTHVVDKSQELHENSLVTIPLTQNDFFVNTEQDRILRLGPYSEDGDIAMINTAIPLQASNTDSNTESELKAAVTTIANACNIAINEDELNTITYEIKHPERSLEIKQFKTEDIMQLFPFVCGICALQFNRIDKYYTHFESHSELTGKYFHLCMTSTDPGSYEGNSSIEAREGSFNANSNLYHCVLCQKTFLTICQLHDHIINEEKVKKYVYDENSRSIDKCHSPIKEHFGRNHKVTLPEKTQSLQMTEMFATSKWNNIATNENVPETIENSQQHTISPKLNSTKNDNVICISLNKYDLIKDMKFEGFDKTTGVRYKLNVGGQTAINNVGVGLTKCIKENSPNTLEECFEENSSDTFEDDIELDDNINIKGEQNNFKKSDIKMLNEKQRLKPRQKRQNLELNGDNVTPLPNGGNKSENVASEVLVSCNICGRRYKKDYIKKHMAVHAHTREYKCTICEKAFKTKNTLLQHEKIHVIGQKVVCQQCGKIFKNPVYLKNHIRIVHGDVEDLPCHICGKRFKTREYLNSHARIHAAYKNVGVGLEKCIKENSPNTLEEGIERNSPDTFEDYMELDDTTNVNGKDNKFEKSDIKMLNEKPRHKRQNLELNGDNVTPLPNGGNKSEIVASEVLVSCNICGRRYKKDYIKYHMAVHAQTRDYKCNICDKAFKSRSTLLGHKQTHITGTNFCCQQCGKTFKTRGYLRNHTRTVHADVEELPCHICGKIFKTREYLNSHTRIHAANNNVGVGLEKCIKENSPNTLEEGIERNSPGTFEDYMELDDTTNVNGEDNNFKKSDIKMLNEKSRQNLELNGDNVTPLPNGNKSEIVASKVLVSCDICGQRYKKDYIKYHMAVHAQTRDYKCIICEKAFKTKNNLQEHQKIHITGTNVLCQQCGKTFKTRVILKKHTRMVHTNGEEFPCHICGKRFKTQGNLRNHTLNHTAVRNLPCQICGKTFTNKVTLKQHTLTHTAVKDIPCPMCPQLFNNKAILKAHMVRHSDSKPFICETCGLGFKRVDQLTNHRYVHTEVRNHTCSTCGKAFRIKYQLVKHQKIHQRT